MKHRARNERGIEIVRNNPVLTHMRKIAYAPVILAIDNCSDDTFAKAEQKREMRRLKRIKLG